MVSEAVAEGVREVEPTITVDSTKTRFDFDNYICSQLYERHVLSYSVELYVWFSRLCIIVI